jgi:hypothetical protein
MAEKKQPEVMAGRKNDLSVVAQDRNWRSYVDNELACQDRWNTDWGFLSGSSHGEGGKFMSAQNETVLGFIN